jgi:hypothetical protein
MKHIVNTEFIATLFAIAGLIGGYFNARNQILLSYKIWLITNLFFVWYNFQINSISQILSNTCYFFLAIIGYITYKKD